MGNAFFFTELSEGTIVNLVEGNFKMANDDDAQTNTHGRILPNTFLLLSGFATRIKYQWLAMFYMATTTAALFTIFMHIKQ